MPEFDTPNEPVEYPHHQRIIDLEKEAVADAIQAMRDLLGLNRQMVCGDPKKAPLAARSTAEAELTSAIDVLIAYYRNHGYQGNFTLTREEVYDRLTGVALAIPPMPLKTTLETWQTFFRLVERVIANDEEGTYKYTAQLVSQFDTTTAVWWAQRVAAYIACMQSYGVLEQTRA